MSKDSTGSLEFNRFEDIRRALVDALIEEGFEDLKAEKVALYVVEGMRDVSRLITQVAHSDESESHKILLALRKMLESTKSFDKARAILLIADPTAE
jgi:hypothetical protein